MRLAPQFLLLSALTACSVRSFDRATLLASTASLACDWRQTSNAAAAGWSGTREANPVMGPHPDTTTVGLYFLGVAFVNAAVWAVVPRGWRSLAPSALVGVQARTIRGNNGTIGRCI